MTAGHQESKYITLQPTQKSNEFVIYLAEQRCLGGVN